MTEDPGNLKRDRPKHRFSVSSWDQPRAGWASFLASVLAAVAVGERLHWRHCVGGAFIVTGAVIIGMGVV